MVKTRFLVQTHLRTGRSIAELARSHGVDKSWLYRAVKRYRIEGEGGLVARSRRPLSSPSRITDRFEDELVELREELLDGGLDERLDDLTRVVKDEGASRFLAHTSSLRHLRHLLVDLRTR